MRQPILLLFLMGLILPSLVAQRAPQRAHPLLLSGPMVGYTEMREALLWVQTDGPATVQFKYKETGAPGSFTMRTAEYRTNSTEAFTARLVADLVQPGKTYEYQILINRQQVRLPYKATFTTPPLWQYRTPPPDLKFAIGSCNFVNDAQYDRSGEPYGGGYNIYTSILQQDPDMMVWLGDNLYLREADWYSRTGIMYRYTHTRALAELQPLLATVPQYAIWDDHDYGPNDSDRSYRDKDVTLEAFQLFWGNPSYGVNGQGGITSMFEKSDCQFILLDNRYFRTPNGIQTEEPQILGEDQLTWLIESLKSSKASVQSCWHCIQQQQGSLLVAVVEHIYTLCELLDSYQ